MVGTALTYYVGFYDENIKDNNLNINEISQKLSEVFEDSPQTCENEVETSILFGSVFYKFAMAFFAGSLLSDKVFLKFGVI